MKCVNPRILKIIACCAALACLLQIYALCRYINHLPDDRLGIGLYIITIYAFAALSIGFFVRAKKQKQ
ncbi:hypothetical protein JXQ31_05575 [candidate division KSB1 bacterium]|nr:hypothetical protein [candidate division KSB1 bacterium]